MTYHSEIRRHTTPLEFSGELLELRRLMADMPGPDGEESESEARHSQWPLTEPRDTTLGHDLAQSPGSYFLCHPDLRLDEAWQHEVVNQRARSCLRC